MKDLLRADLIAIPNLPAPDRLASAIETIVDEWLLSHSPPIDPATKIELGRRLVDEFLGHLAEELDALHWACHSPKLDKLVSNLEENSRSRDRDRVTSDKEFERREELLSLTVAYKATHSVLRELRRQIAAGEFPDTAVMNHTRAAVRMLLGPLSRSDSWLANRIGGQESQKAQFGSPVQKLHRREEFRRMVKDCMIANPDESYRWATIKVAEDNEVSPSWVRTLAPKHKLT
jgi:hypothetical protein